MGRARWVGGHFHGAQAPDGVPVFWWWGLWKGLKRRENAEDFSFLFSFKSLAHFYISYQNVYRIVGESVKTSLSHYCQDGGVGVRTKETGWKRRVREGGREEGGERER